MRSGWFWNTPEWANYSLHYGGPTVWKSSPLDNDHDLDDVPEGYVREERLSQVLDLGVPLKQLWAGVHDKCKTDINKALALYVFESCPYWTVLDYHRLHAQDAGRETRSQGTWDCMKDWVQWDQGMLVMARQDMAFVDGAYFIMHKNGAYYASAASLVADAHKAVLWSAIKFLKWKGVRFLEMGDVTPGGDKKAQDIAWFKTRFGGEAKPYILVRPKEGV